MRHLETIDVPVQAHGDPFMQIKQEDLNNLEDLKSEVDMKAEITDLSLEDCEQFIKNEFMTDVHISNDIELILSPDSELSENCESPKKNEARKNRRKALVPQRAVQSENSQTGSVGNSSESSQDISEPIMPRMHFHNGNSSESSQDITASMGFHADTITTDALMTGELFNSDSELPESEDLLRDIDEENIFKGIHEETDGEKLDDEMMDNVKEEWRAHWGVKCNMCEKVFPFKVEFDKHYVTSYGLTPVYTCSFCNKTVEKYSTFRSHCYRHITEGRYKCKECPKGFSLQSLLQVHMLAKHSKAKPFMCEECGKSFVTKPGLKIHLKKHKTEMKEDYPCVVCGKVLHTRGGLTSHMNVHRLGRRFMCDVCGKTFTQKVNMQQHAKQHTGDKPHGCDKCGKTFAEKSHLARHYSFHSEQRPYKCEVCQKMYKTERCLKVHSMVHSSERPFICTYCSKGFLSSTKLKQHYNVHTGERPYACKYCERKFTNYPNWLKHTRRRHKVDHRTGEDLDAKVPKIEALPTPAAAFLSDLASVTSLSEPPPDVLNTDFTLSKTEELLLQQGLLHFPISDEKFLFHQQVDLFAGSSSSSVGLLVPYFQNQMPSQTLQNSSQLSLPLQLNDFISSQFLQSSLPCD